jgi:hypothetical protein
MTPPSITPNLQEALAVQTYMKDVMAGQVEGLPFMRYVRGQGRTAVDQGNDQASLPAGLTQVIKVVNHQLGMVPTRVICQVTGPTQFNGFGGAMVNACYNFTVAQFTVQLFAPAATVAATITFDWIAFAFA